MNPQFNMRKAMRIVEKWLRDEAGGVQMLYADIFQSRHEFEQMFPHGEWRKLRKVGRAPRAPTPTHAHHLAAVLARRLLLVLLGGRSVCGGRQRADPVGRGQPIWHPWPDHGERAAGRRHAGRGI